MIFHFYCPQGHLLETDASQVGQQCMCPYCRSVFVVPEPPRAIATQSLPDFTTPGAPPVSSDRPTILQEEPVVEPPPIPVPPPLAPPPSESPAAGEEPFPVIQTEPHAGADGPQAGKRPGGRDLPAVLTILCPSGHELETPREMLGQDVLCQYCEAQFLIRYEDSLEYRQEKAERLRLREEAIGRAWMRWSIVAAVVVVLGVIVMIVMAAWPAS